MLRRWSTNSRPESRPWAARPGREEGQVLGSSNDVLGIEYGLPLVDLLDLLGLPPPLQREGLLQPQPVSPHPSHLRRWRTDQGSHFSFTLSPSSPRVLRSPTDSFAVRNALFVAGSFACPSSPCAPLPVSSLPCLCSDTVWLVLWLATVLQGPCQMAVLRESAGLTMNTNADVRLRLLLQPRNTATPAPAADDIPDTTAPPEEEEPDLFDSATNAAFGRLLTALEHPAEASPIMDASLYTVLSRLSHAHSWTSLILDLKDLMPDLDRHYHHQFLVALFQPYTAWPSQSLISYPPNSQVDPPDIDSFFFHPTFWHRHLIHGTNLASPSFFDVSLVDTLAGNQLCQWSTVGAAEGRGTNQKDTLLLASHLIIHLPPRVGAYVLASHLNLARITPDTTGVETNSRSQFRFVVQFRSPQHLAQQAASRQLANKPF